MQSYGNDFVIIDFREENANKDFTANEIIYLADRNYGIGCDQLIVLYKSEIPEDDKSISVNVKIYI